MEIIKLAFRYLRTRHMALLSCGFLGLAVCAMVVVTSVMAGFQQAIRSRIRSVEPDLTIRLAQRPLPRGTLAAIRGELQGELAAAGGPLAALSPRFSTTALLGNKLDEPGGQSRSSTIAVKLVGIDMARDRAVLDWEAITARTAGGLFALQVPLEEDPLTAYPLGGLMLSGGLAANMGFLPGDAPGAASDAAIVVGAFAKDERGQAVIEPSNRTFTLAGCFDSRRDDHDANVVYISLAAFRELRYGDAPDAPDCGFAVARLVDGDRAEAVAEDLRARHPGLEIETWQDHNRTLLTALSVERTVTSAILFFIVALASLLLLGMLYMIIVDKRRDVGILRSMGLGRGRMVATFVTYGGLLGLIGVGAGTLGGMAIVRDIRAITTWMEDRGIHIFSPRIYRDRGIPAVLDGGEVTVIAVSALVVTLLAAAIAAFKSVQATPVENLRYE